MISFDAIRSGDSGPLSYIARPKLPPAELLFCCNFADGVDLSRYGGSVVISGGSKDTTTYALPGIKNGPTITMNLGKEFKRDEPWSIDFIMGKSGNQSTQLSIAGLYLQSDASSYSPGGVWVDASRKINRGAYESATGMIQWAFRYDGLLLLPGRDRRCERKRRDLDRDPFLHVGQFGQHYGPIHGWKRRLYHYRRQNYSESYRHIIHLPDDQLPLHWL